MAEYRTHRDLADKPRNGALLFASTNPNGILRAYINGSGVAPWNRMNDTQLREKALSELVRLLGKG